MKTTLESSQRKLKKITKLATYENHFVLGFFSMLINSLTRSPLSIYRHQPSISIQPKNQKPLSFLVSVENIKFTLYLCTLSSIFKIPINLAHHENRHRQLLDLCFGLQMQSLYTRKYCMVTFYHWFSLDSCYPDLLGIPWWSSLGEIYTQKYFLHNF